MAIAEATWREHRAAQKAAQSVPSIDPRVLKQATVDMALLTGHQGWDSYLTRLQAMLEETEGELKEIYARLGGPLTDEQVRLLYISINVFNERVRILKWCMALPHEILQGESSAAV